MKLRLFLLFTLFTIFSYNISAQIGIGTTNPDNSSILDVESDEKGILIPRMTALERLAITAPAEGLMVYQIDDVKGFYFYDGTSWDRMLKESKDPVPTGAIFSFPLATPPTDYLVCDGSAISRTTYADLFALLGTTYGTGDGATTFNLPDYRGKFLRGHDDGAGNDPDATSRQDRGDGTVGDYVGTLQDGEMASHLHQVDPPSTTVSVSGSHSHYTNSNNMSTNASGNHSHSTNSVSAITNTAGNHTHQIRGEETNITTGGFGTPDLKVDDNNSGSNYINTTPSGNHNHSVNIPSMSTNTRGNHNHNFTIPSLNTNFTGDHNHTANILEFDSSLTGSSENRPINITVIYCIKY